MGNSECIEMQTLIQQILPVQGFVLGAFWAKQRDLSSSCISGLRPRSWESEFILGNTVVLPDP